MFGKLALHRDGLCILVCALHCPHVMQSVHINHVRDASITHQNESHTFKNHTARWNVWCNSNRWTYELIANTHTHKYIYVLRKIYTQLWASTYTSRILRLLFNASSSCFMQLHFIFNQVGFKSVVFVFQQQNQCVQTHSALFVHEMYIFPRGRTDKTINFIGLTL